MASEKYYKYHLASKNEMKRKGMRREQEFKKYLIEIIVVNLRRDL